MSKKYPIGSRQIRTGGYWYVKAIVTIEGWVLEHRALMAQVVGRPLARNEIVHHIDGNRSNNDLSNLTLVDPVAHQRWHLQGHRGPQRGAILICRECSAPVEIHRRKGLCRTCYRRRYVEANAETFREYRKAFRLKLGPEETKRRDRERYKKHRDKVLALKKAQYWAKKAAQAAAVTPSQ